MICEHRVHSGNKQHMKYSIENKNINRYLKSINRTLMEEKQQQLTHTIRKKQKETREKAKKNRVCKAERNREDWLWVAYELAYKASNFWIKNFSSSTVVFHKHGTL